jgi:hypothetical protein
LASANNATPKAAIIVRTTAAFHSMRTSRDAGGGCDQNGFQVACGVDFR